MPAPLTPAQLIDLTNALIIDNTTNQITPYKVRQLMYAIINTISQESLSSITATSPVDIDGFYNISIPKADADNDGYLSAIDFAAFSAASSSPLAPLEIRVLKKAEGNTGGFTKEAGDFVFGEPIAGTFWVVARFEGGDAAILDNYTVFLDTSTT